MPDSPRWCARCEQYGDHHTDRCPKFAQAASDASPHEHEWQPNGTVEIDRKSYESGYTWLHWTEVVSVAVCRCGATRKVTVGRKNERRR